jgi:uncharacterized protein (DUF1800 family)
MGFGAGPPDRALWGDVPDGLLIDRLLNYESVPDDHDSKLGDAAFVGITTSGGNPFSPDTSINDMRQRWLFRMIHSQRPLEEKMALFWHNHFATAYSKVAGAVGNVHGAKMMDADGRHFNGSFRGQVQLFRDMATGNFRDLLIAVAKDPAMIVWLDGRTNTRARPQENFGREIMELFTMGLGHYTEADVVAAARVFTGWTIALIGDRGDPVNSYYAYQYQPNNHDANAKEFTFAIYPDGGRTIAARAAASGEQDGIDLINALARHPATAERLAMKLCRFFVSDAVDPPPALVSAVAQTYLSSGYNMKTALRTLFQSAHFRSPGVVFQRYAWPVEFTVRAIKEIGWSGFSANSALTPLTNMGQQLYEPPDVNGWATGGGWISTSSLLARMNFASTLAQNQRFNLARDAQPYRQSPERLLEYMLARFPTIAFSATARAAMVEYLQAGAGWSGSEAQLQQKVPGLARLIAGAGEYQFN